jgi:hypothetical protein
VRITTEKRVFCHPENELYLFKINKLAVYCPQHGVLGVEGGQGRGIHSLELPQFLLVSLAQNGPSW